MSKTQKTAKRARIATLEQHQAEAAKGAPAKGSRDVPIKGRTLTKEEYEARGKKAKAAKRQLPSERLGVPPTCPDVDQKAAAAPTPPPAAPDAPTAKRGGLEAAAEVLRQAGEPLSCQVMVERMLAQGLWQTGGKTPAATIYAAILREITTKGSASRFRKTDRGRFALAG